MGAKVGLAVGSLEGIAEEVGANDSVGVPDGVDVGAAVGERLRVGSWLVVGLLDGCLLVDGEPVGKPEGT